MNFYNVGGCDRAARVIAGLLILLAGGMYQSYWGLVGLLPLLTGLVRFCPAYLPFKISTVGKSKKGCCCSSASEKEPTEAGCCGGEKKEKNCCS